MKNRELLSGLAPNGSVGTEWSHPSLNALPWEISAFSLASDLTLSFNNQTHKRGDI